MTARRVTLTASATLCVPRRGLPALLARLKREPPPTYDAPLVGEIFAEIPDGPREPQAHLTLDYRGRPAVYIDVDGAIVLRRTIRKVIS